MKFSGSVVIPARFQSSRFPGKPLAEIGNKPMVQHVYDRCSEAVGPESVYVATDSDQIADVVHGFSGQVVMTSKNCLTGTDRIAEANEQLKSDFIVNVQGDEPMINPADIEMIFNIMQNDISTVLNCYCKIKADEVKMPSVPKVVVSRSGKLIYMSRAGVPFDKNNQPHAAYKQICIYGFGREHLIAFAEQAQKTQNEAYEDIEILRFLDMDIPVQMVEVAKGSLAVDTPEDLERCRRVLFGDGY